MAVIKCEVWVDLESGVEQDPAYIAQILGTQLIGHPLYIFNREKDSTESVYRIRYLYGPQPTTFYEGDD